MENQPFIKTEPSVKVDDIVKNVRLVPRNVLSFRVKQVEQKTL